MIVGAETYRATRHAIRYDGIEAIDAKGKAAPVEAWLALEAALGPAERPAGVGALVGRGQELELMRSFWHRALTEQRPHLITLLGPPGIGKSRLCQEIAALVAEDGGRIVRGRCLPYEDQPGYQAFSRVARDVSGILESDSPALAREKLRRNVEEFLPEDETEETFRYLALLLGLAPKTKCRRCSCSSSPRAG